MTRRGRWIQWSFRVTRAERSHPLRGRRRAARSAAVLALALLAVASSAPAAGAAEDDDAPPAYEERGDLSQLRTRGSLRFLVHGAIDHLQREGDPCVIEHVLARALAAKLDLAPVVVPVAEQDDLVTELNEGRGDVIMGSFAITPERSARIVFSRPLRFVDQLVVVHASDMAIQELADLAGVPILVRPSSSYAEALRALASKGITVAPAAETVDTFDLLQQVGRGEARVNSGQLNRGVYEIEAGP